MPHRSHQDTRPDNQGAGDLARVCALVGAAVCFALVVATVGIGVVAVRDTVREYGASEGDWTITVQVLTLALPLVVLLAVPLTVVGYRLLRSSQRRKAPR